MLVLVTELFDVAGPLAVTQKLFDAYDASATPSLHSPNHALYREAQFFTTMRVDGPELSGAALDRSMIAGEVSPWAVSSFAVGDLESFGTWVYKSTPQTRAASGSQKRWERFEETVKSLAA